VGLKSSDGDLIDGIVIFNGEELVENRASSLPFSKVDVAREVSVHKLPFNLALANGDGGGVSKNVTTIGSKFPIAICGNVGSVLNKGD